MGARDDLPTTIAIERTSGPQLWFTCEGHAYRLDHPGTFAHMPLRYRLLAEALMRFAEGPQFEFDLAAPTDPKEHDR